MNSFLKAIAFSSVVLASASERAEAFSFSACEEALAHLSHRPVLYRLGKNIDLYSYVAGKDLYLEQMRNGVRPSESQWPYVPEQKIALVMAGLERIAGFSFVVHDNEAFVRSVIVNTKLGYGRLTRTQARRIVEFLLKQFDADIYNRQHHILFRWFMRDISANYKTAEHDELSEALAKDLVLKNTWRDEVSLYWRDSKAARIIFNSVMANSLLLFFGIPLVDLPNIRITDFSSVRSTTLEKINAGYRSIRKIYMSALFSLGTGYLILHPEPLMAAAQSVQFAARVVTTTKEDMKKYEEAHYSAEAVIQEQLESWRDALDTPPTEAQIQEKLKELREQEAQGILRIYPE